MLFNKNKTALNKIIHRTGCWSDLTEAEYALRLLRSWLSGHKPERPHHVHWRPGDSLDTENQWEPWGGNEVPTSVGCWQRKRYNCKHLRAAAHRKRTWKPRVSLDCLHSSEKGRLCSFAHSEFSLKADTTHPSSPLGCSPGGAHKGVRTISQQGKETILFSR